MSQQQLDKQFLQAQLAQLKILEKLRLSTTKDVVGFLQTALDIITAQINSQPLTDWEAWRLPKLQADIKRTLDELAQELIIVGNKAAVLAWENGIQRVIAPLNTMQPGIVPALISIDTNRLQAMRTFMVDRLKDIAGSAVGKINAQLGMVAIGAIDRHNAIQAVSKLLSDGGKRRAATIIDTELSRMSEVARQQTHYEATKHVSGLKKKWRRSGKIHSRKAHDAADGQIVDIDKPFIIAGHKLMHPHDPGASLEQTINCGCKSLMHVDNWNISHTGKKPFSQNELIQSENKRQIANAEPLKPRA